MPGQIAFEIVFGIDGPSVGSRSVVFEVFAEDVSISVGSCRRQVAQPGSDSHGTFYKFFDGVAVGVAQNLEPCRGPSWRLEVTLIDAGVAWRFVIAGVPATASTSGVGGAADSGATVAAANRARNEIFIINNNCDDLSQRYNISFVFANFILIIA